VFNRGNDAREALREASDQGTCVAQADVATRRVDCIELRKTLVEAAGVEPASEDSGDLAPTCLALRLISFADSSKSGDDREPAP